MMHRLIPLALLLAVSTPIQALAGDAKAIAPFLGEEVAAVVHIDLKTWDARAFVRRVADKLADEEVVNDATKAVDDWAAALKAAGANDLFVLIDPADMPGMPVAVVPLTGESDGKAVADLLKGKGPNAAPPNLVPRWPACETFRGAVVAGSPAALARIHDNPPVARPDLAAALDAGGDASVQVAINLSNVQRRALEEALPELPTQLGGGPITTITRGARWASLTVDLTPKPILRAEVRAKNADAAKAVEKVTRDTLGLLARQGQNDPSLTALVAVLGQLNPRIEDDRVFLDADLEKTAALVAVPIQKAREAARRSQCVNNLKQIGLAMHNYHDVHKTFPPAYRSSKDGKALLSWRVLILPYLEQQALFEEFHLDEPWDSPHNKLLISRMPAIYACPDQGRALTRDGKTTYLTPRGPATIFPGAESFKIQEITDGTSNTIFVVDASDDLAVTWTKPDDWQTAPEVTTRGLFGHHPGGLNVGFADGSVHFVRETIVPMVLHALTTRSGGEVIDRESY